MTNNPNVRNPLEVPQGTELILPAGRDPNAPPLTSAQLEECAEFVKEMIKHGFDNYVKHMTDKPQVACF